MLQTAIEIAGPYVWERCDFLILPPSFPLGGMENTNLIYLTPTMIVCEFISKILTNLIKLFVLDRRSIGDTVGGARNVT
jgi:hypothetical protein